MLKTRRVLTRPDTVHAMAYRDREQALLARIDALEQELEKAREFEDKFHSREEQNRSLKTMVGSLQQLVETPAQPAVEVDSVSLYTQRLRHLIETAETTLQTRLSATGQSREECKSELAKAKDTLRRGEAELIRLREVTTHNMRATLQSLSKALHDFENF